MKAKGMRGCLKVMLSPVEIRVMTVEQGVCPQVDLDV